MIRFLKTILAIDSTSGKENELALFIKNNIDIPGAELEIQETPNGRLNLFYKWGTPDIIFCSHLDTVPPYIPSVFEDEYIYGRGSCDAKGQLAVMFEVCRALYLSGKTNFALLMLSGEEDGSHCAKTANELIIGNKFVIIGEPTRNKLIEASKGTLLAKVNFKGLSCHSGYSQYGDSSITRMLIFLNRLDKIKYEYDEVLGETNYNLGRLKSDNAHNVVPDDASVNIFFRTTWKSYKLIKDILTGLSDEKTNIAFSSYDEPFEFYTLPGFETGIVSYGTDAPSLSKLGKKLLYGPGSILTAHTDNEFVKIDDLYRGVDDLKKIFSLLEEEISREPKLKIESEELV